MKFHKVDTSIYEQSFHKLEVHFEISSTLGAIGMFHPVEAFCVRVSYRGCSSLSPPSI
jgi:hypothetical protein